MHGRYKEIQIKKGKRCRSENERAKNPRSESPRSGLVGGFWTQREENSVRFHEEGRRAD
jgi:hypothetical protein